MDQEIFPDETTLSQPTSRRDFLKYVGFSTAMATLASCEGPVQKAIPYLIVPEQVLPGEASYYATAIADGFDFACVLVKTREGRPIRVMRNPQAPYRGVGNARVQASVLSLYDGMRAKSPQRRGEALSWEALDKEMLVALTRAQEQGKRIVLLTGTLASPSTHAILKDFIQRYPLAEHISYDAISHQAALSAYQRKYGLRALANYDFSRAQVIVSFGADFLGDWQGGGYAVGYGQKRMPTSDGGMSKHFQFESNMTLTGANADERIALKPSELKRAFAKFCNLLVGLPTDVVFSASIEEALHKAVQKVKEAGADAVIVTDIEDVAMQSSVLELNEEYLHSKAYLPHEPLLLRQGDTDALLRLIEQMNAGEVGVLIIAHTNPLYTLPQAQSEAFRSGLHKVDCSLAFALREDETASQMTYLAPLSHSLESWGDVEPKAGYYALTQPTIRPLFDTRQFQEGLLRWMGVGNGYYEYLKTYWKTHILKGGTTWEQALHDGFYINEVLIASSKTNVIAIEELLKGLATASQESFELQLYTSNSLGDGGQAGNPWLQELPDPITRLTWDNYLTMSAHDAEVLGIRNWTVPNGGLDGDCAEIQVGEVKLHLPVLIQAGQARGSVGLALGYGRKAGLKKELQIGENAYPLYKNFLLVQQIQIAKASGNHSFAAIQRHNTLMGRGDILRQTSLEDFLTQDATQWNKPSQVALAHKQVKATSVSLWKEHDDSIGHLFHLSIDLNACIGCGACVVACQSENNIPVVGKEEVRLSRDMHWLRIDRYYSSESTFLEDEAKAISFGKEKGGVATFKELEIPAESPQIAFQPVMCQHCNNAPCETVCPVGATSHGSQGQNQMAYSRCVGTRYCANNCPYKVRRFNWFKYHNNEAFDYHLNDDYGRLVLNPDVVVRSRGVIEKCSLCIQGTQSVILKAKLAGRTVRAGEFADACACAEACPTGALVFGDRNEKQDPILERVENKRTYFLLEHLGTRPNVSYQVKVRNQE